MINTISPFTVAGWIMLAIIIFAIYKIRRLEDPSPKYSNIPTSLNEATIYPQLTENQRLLFSMEMNSRRKKKGTAMICTLFGGIGVHYFYLENTLCGVLAILLCWTGIPALWSLVELVFFTCGYVDQYNARLAREIAGKILSNPPPPAPQGAS